MTCFVAALNCAATDRVDMTKTFEVSVRGTPFCLPRMRRFWTSGLSRQTLRLSAGDMQQHTQLRGNQGDTVSP
jgi:hypothetical protein